MNIDDYESLPTTSVAINMTAGAIAGVLEHIVMYPMDSVKTRMQSLLAPQVSRNTIANTFQTMIQKEGIMRPIRGVTAVLAGAGPGHALYFASYELSKEFMTKVTKHNHINYLTSGVVATVIHDAISNPADVIKQRMQMYNSPYKSVLACLKGIYKTEGLRAFYRSYSTQLVMNIPSQAIHFTTYELFQNLLNHERKYNPPVHVIAGGAAGACAAAITTPLDVVKTLLNTQETGLVKGMLEAMKKIYTVAGPSGFFKGITARVLYAMPATAICWSTYEFFKFYLCGINADDYKSSVSGKNSLQPRESSADRKMIPSAYVVLQVPPQDSNQSPSSLLPPIAATKEATPATANSTTTTTATSFLPPTSSSSSSADSTSTSTPTLTPQTIPGPATAPVRPIKTVCELSTGVTAPSLNLNTRHAEVKRPFERGFSSP